VSQFGIIEKNTDQDWFRFTTGSGVINLTIQSITKAWINNGGSFGAEYLTPPSGATNLDIWAGIYGSNGTTLIAQSNPTDLLSANFSNLFLNAGTYYLAIDGVGKGDLITGYSDYGSLGQYAIAGTIIGNGMTVTPIAGLTTTEAGGTATFTVVLNTAPTDDVVITLNSSNTNEGTIDKSTLTFTTANWNIAQQVTVTGVDDAINDGDQNYSIILNPASSTDANYKAIDPRDVSLVNINNDLPVLNITTSPQVIVEGVSSPQSVVYTVGLTGLVNNSQTVTVQYTTSNGSAISGSDYTSTTGTLTFTGGVTSQNITIPIINNALNETDETFILTLSNPTQVTLGNTASVITTITDTLVTDVTTTLARGVENLTLIGVNAINGTGNSSNNILIGNSSNNILNGSTGIDNLIGGIGDDIYVVDTTTDVITENAGEGTDTIQSSVTFAVTALTNIENLTLTGSSAINGTGNTGNNTLTGNNANNILNGGAGIDTLNGVRGIDTLIGGTGDDIYIVDTITDIITENAGEGTDTIQSSVTFSLTALTHIENLTLTRTSSINGTGNAANNIITGNTGNNTLNGGDGIDTLIGGVGNDIYIVDTTTDRITENAGEGTDTIQSSVTFSLSPLTHIEKLTLIGTSAINGTGNAINNIITGNTANNILTGGDGIDTLVGGTGNDIYIVDTTTDRITEASASGTDTVQSSVTFSISSLTNIENLTLTGSNGINGTGNVGSNTIIGNTTDNLLTGGGGSDTLTGGLGVDRFSYKTLGDSLLGTTNNRFDVITDFNANASNDLFLVSTARSGFIDVGAIATLDATGIGAALTTTAFKANYAAQFTFGSGSTTRTFIAINNSTAGFSATADAIVELTGLTGTIGLGNFTII
jgi:Ca2+-binding RTX toxin-like protein